MAYFQTFLTWKFKNQEWDSPRFLTLASELLCILNSVRELRPQTLVEINRNAAKHCNFFEIKLIIFKFHWNKEKNCFLHLWVKHHDFLNVDLLPSTSVWESTGLCRNQFSPFFYEILAFLIDLDQPSGV